MAMLARPRLAKKWCWMKICWKEYNKINEKDAGGGKSVGKFARGIH